MTGGRTAQIKGAGFAERSRAFVSCAIPLAELSYAGLSPLDVSSSSLWNRLEARSLSPSDNPVSSE